MTTAADERQKSSTDIGDPDSNRVALKQFVVCPWGVLADGS